MVSSLTANCDTNLLHGHPLSPIAPLSPSQANATQAPSTWSMLMQHEANVRLNCSQCHRKEKPVGQSLKFQPGSDQGDNAVVFNQ